MVIPIDEQLRRYEETADQALDLLIAFIQTNRDVIKRAESRRLCGLGEDEYGDATWHKEPLDCLVGCLEEVADATFWLVPALEKLGFVACLKLMTGLGPEDVQA
jgi:hypothetical protein